MLGRRRRKNTVVPGESAAAIAGVAIALALVAVVARLIHNRVAESAGRSRFRVDPAEPLPSELRRSAREQVDGAIALLSGEHAAGPKAVHETRKRLRRLRALLRVTRHQIGDREFEREHEAIRGIARRLGPARDAHVMIATLDSLTTEFRREIPASAFAGLGAALELEDRIEHERLGLQLRSVGGALPELRALRDRVAGWPLPERAPVRDLEAGMASVHRRARKAAKLARAKPTTENLHRLRRRSKDLRQSIKLAGDGSDQAKQLDSDIHELTDLLGDDHDLDLLGVTARRHADTLTPGHLELLEALIARRRDALQHDALRLAKGLFDPAPGIVSAD